jgi:glycosyltransferase involved in cell wall biosynthesis
VKISIITAVYNNEAQIGTAIESVLGQTYPHIEYIIIDGGSTDATMQVVNSYKPSIAAIISEPDKGIYDALNKGIGIATGDVIGFMHSDDMFAGTGIVAQVAAEFSKPAVDTVYGDLQYVSKEDSLRVVRYWKSSPFQLHRLYKGWMPPHPTVYLRRAVYMQYGVFDTSFRIAADYDFMLRIFRDNKRTTSYIPQVLVKMRVGGESNSIKNYIRKWKEDYRALRRNRMGGLKVLAVKNLSKLGQFLK